MARRAIRDFIRAVEPAEPEEQWTMLCFLAGRGVVLDASDLKGALRRAELLLAAGGDPRRTPDLYGRAVTAVAEDLDSESARAQLLRGLGALRSDAEGLRGASEALRLLERDSDLAWQCFACALLAEELGAEGAADD